MKRLAVFCGSNMGASPAFEVAARELGHELAARRIELLFGGSDCGLMGLVARSVLEHGGRATGVLSLRDEKFAIVPNLSTTEVVASTALRKARLLELCDTALALPGGLGTLDELFDFLALRALDEHQKPLGLLSVEGFYDPLMAFLDGAVEAGFIKVKSRALIECRSEVGELLDVLL